MGARHPTQSGFAGDMLLLHRPLHFRIARVMENKFRIVLKENDKDTMWQQFLVFDRNFHAFADSDLWGKRKLSDR